MRKSRKFAKLQFFANGFTRLCKMVRNIVLPSVILGENDPGRHSISMAAQAHLSEPSFVLLHPNHLGQRQSCPTPPPTSSSTPVM
jgi:hypothetical protein